MHGMSAASRIAQQLSETIVREIGSNTWASSPTAKKYTTTIFRAPTPRAELHDAAHKRTYHPSFLSIGPYHCGDNNATAEMLRNEQGKLWAAGFVLRSGVAGAPAVLEYAEAVAAMEADARSCYEGDVGMRPDAFCRMLLLDSCQLIILLLLYFGGSAEADAAGGGTDDGSSHSHSHGSAASAAGQAERSVKTRDICMTVHDLMMLENQIPFFVVDKIYQLRYGGGVGDTVSPPVRSLAWEAMQVIMGGVPAAPGGHDDKQELQHLVHLCHLYLKPTCLVNHPQVVVCPGAGSSTEGSGEPRSTTTPASSSDCGARKKNQQAAAAGRGRGGAPCST
ncbi:hypothetical protein BS78_02G026500 [Paspalum vaginatum]|nr:hypothetical protein BS78_02G026500 [Paspalum vaginatum]